ASGGQSGQYSGCNCRRSGRRRDRRRPARARGRGAGGRRRRGRGAGPQDPRAPDLPRPRRCRLRGRPRPAGAGGQPVHPLRRHPQGTKTVLAGRRAWRDRRAAGRPAGRGAAQAGLHRRNRGLRRGDAGVLGERGADDPAARGL
ncbi:MAG: D-aminoacyl-tRNA deacylase, partial [uncultured Blastococcus sp.]